MPATYDTYILRLPSGRHVLVRRPDGTALFSAGALLFPLLSRAMSAVNTDDEDHPTTPVKPFDALKRYCEVCLVSPRMPEDLVFDQIPISDAMAIYEWAVLERGHAVPSAPQAYRAHDFVEMVSGEGALWLDLVAHRYSQRPSECLGVADAEWGLDLDLAVAYRGMRRESEGADGEVEVEDMFGGTHKVPRKWLASEVGEQGHVIKAHQLVKAHGVGTALSMGGGYGSDGRIGPMPTPGTTERLAW